ncbi:hypothetical protein M422DRAFT_127140, partial [Sphaerobolus stellatus SS14]
SFLILGSAIHQRCFQTVGEFFTHEVVKRENHKLFDIGPCGVVRHPGYMAG